MWHGGIGKQGKFTLSAYLLPFKYEKSNLFKKLCSLARSKCARTIVNKKNQKFYNYVDSETAFLVPQLKI